MSDSVDRVFVHALNTVKKIPRTGSARPPPADRLKLYGLYKQSMEGDVAGVMGRPQGDREDTSAEREKWDAWNRHKGLSKTEAKRRYITILIETMHKYASNTPDARELVSELEFVWDQIKTNVPSSISSSPPASQPRSRRSRQSKEAKTPPPTAMIQSYASFPAGRASASRADGSTPALKILSPLSQDDNDELAAQIEGDGAERDRFSDAVDHHANEATTMEQGSALDKNKERERRWQKRVEHALLTISAEMAALREQLESAQYPLSSSSSWSASWFFWSPSRSRRGGFFSLSGLFSLLAAAVRHVLLDASIGFLLFLWWRARRRRRQRRIRAGGGGGGGSGGGEMDSTLERKALAFLAPLGRFINARFGSGSGSGAGAVSGSS